MRTRMEHSGLAVRPFGMVVLFVLVTLGLGCRGPGAGTAGDRDGGAIEPAADAAPARGGIVPAVLAAPDPGLDVARAACGTMLRAGGLQAVARGESITVATRGLALEWGHTESVRFDRFTPLGRLELRPAGTATRAPAIVAVPMGWLVVVEDEALVAVAAGEQGTPEAIAATWDRGRLGLRPTDVRIVAGRVFVLGRDGVVEGPEAGWFTADRAADGRSARWTRRITTDATARDVASTVQGIVATAGRRIYRVDDGSFVGSASWLTPTPSGGAWPGAFAYARAPAQAGGPTVVGFLDAGLREVDRTRASVALEMPIRDLVFGDRRLFAVSERGLIALTLDDDGLQVQRAFTVSRPLVVATSGGPATFADAAGRWVAPRTLQPSSVDEPAFGPEIAAGYQWSQFDGRTLRLAFDGHVTDRRIDGPPHQVDPARPRRPETSAGSAGSAPRAALVDPVVRVTVRAGQMERTGPRTLVWTDDTGRQVIDLDRDAGTLAAVAGTVWIGGRDAVLRWRPGDDRPHAIAILDGMVVALHPLLDGSGAVAVTDRGQVMVMRHPGDGV